MHAKLQLFFNALEDQRAEWLHKVSVLSDEAFKRSPSPGKWSVSSILTHIMTAEQLSLLYMRKKSLGINQLENSGILEELKLLLLKVSQRIPSIKYKAPQVVVEKTPEALSFHELNAQWTKSREQLKRFLENIEEKNLRKKIYKHNVVGRLNVMQALAFLHEHFRHHLPQIKRLL